MKFKLDIFIIFTVFISLILIQSSDAFIVYLRPPRMVIRMNVTSGEYSTGDGIFEVKNLNNETVNLELIPRGYFAENVVFDSGTSFDLEPDEGRNVSFQVKLDEPGFYNETIAVRYSMGTENPVNLELDVKIYANEVEKPKNDILKYSIIGFIVLIIIIIVLFVFLRGGVKSEE